MQTKCKVGGGGEIQSPETGSKPGLSDKGNPKLTVAKNTVQGQNREIKQQKTENWRNTQIQTLKEKNKQIKAGQGARKHKNNQMNTTDR